MLVALFLLLFCFVFMPILPDLLYENLIHLSHRELLPYVIYSDGQEDRQCFSTGWNLACQDAAETWFLHQSCGLPTPCPLFAERTWVI